MQYIGPIIAAIAAAIAAIAGYRAKQLSKDIFIDQQYKTIITTLQTENRTLRKTVNTLREQVAELQRREIARTNRELKNGRGRTI